MMNKKNYWLLIPLFLIIIIWLIYPYILQSMANYLVVKDQISTAEAIVVLGGDGNGERVEEGIALYKNKYAPLLILSAGPLAWHLTEAEWMGKQAVAGGVPFNKIVLEDQSRSTLENALFVRQILLKKNIHKIILVTSPTHTRRASLVFNNILAKDRVAVLSWPATKSKFIPEKWWQRHEDIQLVIWEYVSLLLYFFEGNLH